MSAVMWCRGVVSLLRGGVLALLMVGVVACATLPPERDVVLDRGRPVDQRLAAVQGMSLSGAGHEVNAEAIAALHVLVWSDRHPLELRVAAMDRLIEETPDDFWSAADRWFASVDDDALARDIGERAVRDGRRDFWPALLQRWSYGRGSGRQAKVEFERVEYVVFAQAVSPEAVEDALWAVVSHPEQGRPTGRGVPPEWSAWVVLSRLETPDRLQIRLAQTPGPATPLVEALRASQKVLGERPATLEGVRWLMVVHQNPEAWSGFAAVPLADRGPGSSLALRHLEAVRQRLASHEGWVEPEAADVLAQELPDASWFSREQPAGLSIDWAHSAAGELNRADQLILQEIIRAMRNRAVVASWFAQADADLADPTTEYGGVLTWDAYGESIARAYPPQQREGDRKFFSSPALVDAMYTGLAHYHFHAQSFDNTEYAGPGRGDLAFTDAMEANTLTLTFIDRDRLNVDLAFPGGRVLDLGCVHRPADD
ncbi:MAG: hypothetical protein AAGF84_14635 [Planctomycetota bacterium]